MPKVVMYDSTLGSAEYKLVRYANFVYASPNAMISGCQFEAAAARMPNEPYFRILSAVAGLIVPPALPVGLSGSFQISYRVMPGKPGCAFAYDPPGP